MCRNIKTLYNFDPPAADEEIRASALQFVVSGAQPPFEAELTDVRSAGGLSSPRG